VSVNEITALFDEWNNALQTGDPKQVAALYENNGILLPTCRIKCAIIQQRLKITLLTS